MENFIRYCFTCILLFCGLISSATFVFAQTQLTNLGTKITVENGTWLAVPGAVTTDNTGSIENKGAIKVGGDWTNTGWYNFSTGRLILNGTAPQNFQTSLRDSVHTLVVSNPNGVTLSNELVVVDSVYFNNGKMITSTSPSDKLIFTDGVGFVQTVNTSFVEGYLNIQGTGNKTFPIGEGLAYRPVTLYNISGTDPELSFRVLPYSFGGSAGPGLAYLSLTRHWVGEVADGDYKGADNIEIQFDADDFPDAPPIIGFRIGQAEAPDAPMRSLGYTSSSGSGPYLMRTDSIKDLTGYFAFGRGQNIAGDIVPTNATICYADSAYLATTGNEPGGTVQWWYSLDGSSYSPVLPNAYGDNLHLHDNLQQTTYFKTVVSGTDLLDGESNPQMITVLPTVKLKLKAWLEGPYHANGDTMYHHANGLEGGAAGNLLSDRYKTGGSEPETMYSWRNIPHKAVDVVNVELWKDINSDGFPEQKVDEAKAWILHDGRLVNFYNDSTDYLNFCVANNSDEYFFVIRHRNHISIMSETGRALAYSIPGSVFDMTDLNHIYNYGCVEVESGVMGLAAGNVFDSFGDGDIEEVNAIDFNFGLYNNTFPQLVNYSNLDADLDGVANSVDYLKISNNADMLIRTEAPVTAP